MSRGDSLITIGRVEPVSFPELGIADIHARIDTGARTSAIWASGIDIDKTGKLRFYIFDKTSRHFVKEPVVTGSFDEVIVSSSMGSLERRYRVKLLVRIHGKKIRGSFTLSDRSTQVYPILIGRNILRGKPDRLKEQARYDEFEEMLKKGENP
jgi:hypothetical protein